MGGKVHLVCRVARPGACGGQNHRVLVNGQRNVRPHVHAHARPPGRHTRHRDSQDDPPTHVLPGRRGVLKLHGQRVRPPRVDRLPAWRSRGSLDRGVRARERQLVPALPPALRPGGHGPPQVQVHERLRRADARHRVAFQVPVLGPPVHLTEIRRRQDDRY